MRLTERGHVIVLDKVTERGHLIVGNLTERGQSVTTASSGIVHSASGTANTVSTTSAISIKIYRAIGQANSIDNTSAIAIKVHRAIGQVNSIINTSSSPIVIRSSSGIASGLVGVVGTAIHAISITTPSIVVGRVSVSGVAIRQQHARGTSGSTSTTTAIWQNERIIGRVFLNGEVVTIVGLRADRRRTERLTALVNKSANLVADVDNSINIPLGGEV